MAEGRFASGRHAGAQVPLFSIASRTSWGIGEVADLPRLARWLVAAGLDIVQLLPVNEMPADQNSPYSAVSAMAIDPLFISLGDLEDFTATGGETSLSPDDRVVLAQVRQSRSVDYRHVRRLKWGALRQAFARFFKTEWQTSSARDLAFRSFRFRERWWLDDYGLFRALHDENQSRYWREWEPAVRDRDPAALEASRERLHALILYYEYLQWVADDQWQRARRACGHVGVFGDFPFMVSGHSADVWARQHEFRHDASVGVPPDAFSETGQDWGLPVYRWTVMAEGGHAWLRQRARRCAELYDGFRVDHLVGFYRTFVRERDGSTAFIPPDEPSQRAQGEHLLSMFSSSGARIIGEDLGLIPDFVRESMARLRVPGLKVLRWERDWHTTGQPFRDPAEYPSDSVATTGTHDMEPLAEWWDAADPDERRAAAALTRSHETDCASDSPFSDRLRDALLASLYGAGSDVVLMPLQDIFGWRDRVNTPAVTSEGNWSWRLPWPVEDLLSEPEAVERAGALADLGRRYARGMPV